MSRLFGSKQQPPPPTAADLRQIDRSFVGRISIADPAFAAYFGTGTPNYSGVEISEQVALSIPAVWRATSLISGTIASLDAGTVVTNADGTKERIDSWVDAPAGPDGLTAYEFWETVVIHLLIHGNAYLLHIRNGAGAMAGLLPIHPMAVSIEVDPLTLYKTFKVTLDNQSVKVLDSTQLLHIPALGTNGIHGLSPITVARNSLGTAVAGERSAANMFSNGPLISGLVTPEDDDFGEEDAKIVKASLDSKMAGYEHAGEIALVNRRLKFTPWQQTHEDAQFLQSRQFQIEEIARWFGVPPYELMQTEKQTSWGTGIEAQQRGLARQVLHPWVKRIEQRVSRLMPRGRELKFDFHDLERPTPEQEVQLLVAQVTGGIMTVNEARAVRNLPPIEGGDGLQAPALPAPEEVTV